MSPTPWKTSCFELLTNPGTLVYSLCCPAIAYYNATESINPDKPANEITSVCGGYCCCIGFRVRTQLRESRGLRGSLLGDFCSHCLCHCLALGHVWQEAAAWEAAERSISPGRPRGDAEPLQVPQVAQFSHGPTCVPGGEVRPETQPPRDQYIPQQHRDTAHPHPGPSGPRVPGPGSDFSLSTHQSDATDGTGLFPGEGEHPHVVTPADTNDVLKKYGNTGGKRRNGAKQIDTATKMMILGSNDVQDVHAEEQMDPRARLERLKRRGTSGSDKPKEGSCAVEVGPNDVPLEAAEVTDRAASLAEADTRGALGGNYFAEAGTPFDCKVDTNQFLRDSLTDQLDALLSHTNTPSGSTPPGSSTTGASAPGVDAESKNSSDLPR